MNDRIDKCCDGTQQCCFWKMNWKERDRRTETRSAIEKKTDAAINATGCYYIGRSFILILILILLIIIIIILTPPTSVSGTVKYKRRDVVYVYEVCGWCWVGPKKSLPKNHTSQCTVSIVTLIIKSSTVTYTLLKTQPSLHTRRCQHSMHMWEYRPRYFDTCRSASNGGALRVSCGPYLCIASRWRIVVPNEI